MLTPKGPAAAVFPMVSKATINAKASNAFITTLLSRV